MIKPIDISEQVKIELNLDAFKEECIATKRIRTSNTSIWEDLYKEQKQYGKDYRMLNSLLGVKKCPNCKRKLNKKFMFGKDGYHHYIYSCTCGYKYAKSWREGSCRY